MSINANAPAQNRLHEIVSKFEPDILNMWVGEQDDIGFAPQRPDF